MTAAPPLFAAENFQRVRLPPQEAEPLPHWAYIVSALVRAGSERIFRKSWTYVGHVNQLPIPGDFLTVEITGVPLIVVKGPDVIYAHGDAVPRLRQLSPEPGRRGMSGGRGSQ